GAQASTVNGGIACRSPPSPVGPEPAGTKVPNFDSQAGGGGSGGGSSRPAGPDDATTGPPQPVSVMERLAGEWLLESWAEAGGPVTLYIEAREGNLTITGDGDADWRLEI